MFTNFEYQEIMKLPKVFEEKNPKIDFSQKKTAFYYFPS